MIVADEWLLDLAVQGACQRSVALLCMRTQIRAFNRHGHIIALNDEITKENIRRAGRAWKIPNTIVRCIRCGCQAWFIDWMAMCDLEEHAILEMIIPYAQQRRDSDLDFLRYCKGDEMADGLMAIVGME